MFFPPKFESGFHLRSRVLVLDDLGQLAVLVGLEGDDSLVKFFHRIPFNVDQFQFTLVSESGGGSDAHEGCKEGGVKLGF